MSKFVEFEELGYSDRCPPTRVFINTDRVTLLRWREGRDVTTICLVGGEGINVAGKPKDVIKRLGFNWDGLR